MGLIATLFSLAKSELTQKGNAPGKSVVANGDGFEGQVVTQEVYQAPGVFGIPGDGVRGISIPVGGSSRVIVIAVHNYKIEIDVGGQGGAAIYSTDAAGSTVKSKIILKPNGTIEINGNDKQFVTWDALNTALQSFRTSLTTHVHSGVTTGGGSSGPPATIATLDISSAKTTTVKTGG